MGKVPKLLLEGPYAFEFAEIKYYTYLEVDFTEEVSNLRIGVSDFNEAKDDFFICCWQVSTKSVYVFTYSGAVLYSEGFTEEEKADFRKLIARETDGQLFDYIFGGGCTEPQACYAKEEVEEC